MDVENKFINEDNTYIYVMLLFKNDFQGGETAGIRCVSGTVNVY